MTRSSGHPMMMLAVREALGPMGRQQKETKSRGLRRTIDIEAERRRARCSFVGKHRLDVILHSRLGDGPKYISMPALKSAFGVAGFVLTEEEVLYLVKKFGDNRGRIDWRRLMVALDVTAPADFTDPDRSFLDSLPQPYRLIVSVLDTDIVDRAWALIVERHPELDTSVADEARAAAEVDLKRFCPPPTRLRRPHPPISQEEGPQPAAVTSPIDVSEEGKQLSRVENDLERRDSCSLPDEGKKENPKGANVNTDSSGNHFTQDIRTEEDGGGRGDGGGVAVLRWDSLGKMLFTGGHDGSVCIRMADALDEVAVQASCTGAQSDFSDRTENSSSPWTVRFLSRPVGELKDQLGRSSSVRIAAVLTSPAEEDGAGLKEKSEHGKEIDGGDVEGALGGPSSNSKTTPQPSKPTSCVSVLEVTTPAPKGDADDMNGISSYHSQRLGPSGDTGRSGNSTSHGSRSKSHHMPALRAICLLKLVSSERAVTCALSADGRRLAVSLSSGRVATWVLPYFKSPSEVHLHSPLRQESNAAGGGGEDGRSERPDTTTSSSGGEIAAGGESGGTTVSEGRTCTAGDDDVAEAAKAKADAVAEEAAKAPPVELMQPEFSIPPVPSPEELAYVKAVKEYRKREEAGELQQLASNLPVGDNKEGTPRPPTPPKPSDYAHHLAQVEFLPAVDVEGGRGSGGGLSLWRRNSNVWRLYRLQPPPNEEADGKTGKDGKGTENEDGETAQISRAATVESTSDEEGVKISEGVDGPLSAAKFDILSLPSAEWVLPSPITALSVSEGMAGEGFPHNVCEMGYSVEGGSFSSCSTKVEGLLPLLAIGTEDGGVYLCDAVLGVIREGLSRHRSRVTSLAFHGKTFLVSGSTDEMIQIHHVSVAASATIAPATGCGGLGGTHCSGGTPRLRCLHDARGGGIIRVACFREPSLAFAEDTLGRIVAYDLVSGSMLGVLALTSNPVESAKSAKSEIHRGGGTSVAEMAEQHMGLIWETGGSYLAAMVQTDEEVNERMRQPTDGRGETLGIWSAADLMWEFSPGMRGMVGEMRPLSSSDMAALFFGLTPAQRKAIEGEKNHRNQSNLSGKSPRGDSLTPASAAAGSTHAHRNQSFLPATTPVALGGGIRPSRDRGMSGGSGGGHGNRGDVVGYSPPRTSGTRGGHSAVSKQESTPKTTLEDLRVTSHHSPNRTTLTEGNVARLTAVTDGKLRSGCFLGGVEGFGAISVEVGSGGPWHSETGAVGRVQQYMKSRGGERTARKVRLETATQNVLHGL